MRALKVLFPFALTAAALWPQRIAETPERVTLCELAAAPAKYDGTMIAVRASVIGFKEQQLEDYEHRCGSYIVIVLEYPKDVRPSPGFDLIEDDSLRAFRRANGRYPLIDATFEGRFDSAVVVRKGAPVRVCRGFGNADRAQGRLVVRRVYDVVTKNVPRK